MQGGEKKVGWRKGGSYIPRQRKGWSIDESGWRKGGLRKGGSYQGREKVGLQTYITVD
jgi:hypothetical protein